MRVEIENEGEVISRLTQAEGRIALSVENGQKEFAEELKDKLENTSPVKTGRYKGNWEITEEGDEIFVTNDTPYARFLVFPNERMKGSPKADDPSRGILHNVRGLTFSRRASYTEKMTSKIRKAASSLFRRS